MPVFISMLRGINVGSHGRIKMGALCAIYKSLKLEDPRAYVQSGNVIFKTKESNAAALAAKIQAAIEHKAGINTGVVLRTPAEFRNTIHQNPFSKRRDLNPGKLLVTFLADEPAREAREQVLALKPDPEELHLIGREIYIYFPNGAGRSRLQWSTLDKKLGTCGTARNWNSVTRMLDMAEEMEAGA